MLSNHYSPTGDRRPLRVGLLLLIAILYTQCRQGRPTFSAHQLHDIAAVATRGAARNVVTTEATYEQANPFGPTLQPPLACGGHPMRALVYVADDPRNPSLVMYLDERNRILCIDRPHILDITSR